VVPPTPNTSSGTAAPVSGPYEMKICRVEVVEKGSGWPVPLIELRTTHLQRFVTDNAGVIAFDSPELMGHHWCSTPADRPPGI
jgi:hypothetical protein